MSDVLKRGGKRQTEPYNHEKLFDSLIKTLNSLKVPAGQAEDTANAVCASIEQWLKDRQEVTSDDLRRKAALSLSAFHEEAANLYQHHKIIM